MDAGKAETQSSGASAAQSSGTVQVTGERSVSSLLFLVCNRSHTPPLIPSFSIISIMVQRGSLSFSHLFVIPLNMSDHELLIYEPPEPWQHPLTPKRCHRSVQAIPTVAGEAAAFANGQMVRIKTSYWKQLQVPAAAKSGSCHWRVCHFSGFSYTLSLPHSGNVLECVPPDAMEAALGEAVATQMNRCI